MAGHCFREYFMDLQAQIEAFLAGSPFAVVGASPDRRKYGNKVLRAMIQAGRKVYPIHPTAKEVEGLPAYRSLAEVPEQLHGVSVVVPPEVTESIIDQLGELGIQHVWMQPGAESEGSVEAGQKLGLNVIAGGPCLLVSLRYRE
jgi:predicted CoA-binding protein